MMEMPKYVLSTKQTEAYVNTTILRSPEILPKLKQEAEGDILLLCGPRLFAELSSKRLIDEYMLYVCPSAIGQGTHIFRDIPENIKLTFERAIPFSSGMNLHYYTPVYES
jgi:riboflavin biosynthesis pyrimidine reductase